MSARSSLLRSALTERPMRFSRGSTLVTSASTESPGLKSADGLSTRSVESCETCTSPSIPSSSSTNTPKSVTLVNAPLTRVPGAAVGGVAVEHLDLDLLAHLEHLRGMRHPLGPRHLRDVDQALDAPLDLDEGAVLGEAHDLAADARVDRQALGDRRPRIGHDLLHAERDALALRVVLEDDHLHALADVDDLGGMRDPAPRHVGHVEEPVDAAEIDERAVVRDVLDRTLEDDALLQHLERLGLERRALALEDRSPGHHHVPARAVELEDGEAPALADVAIEVARRPEVGVRAGEERGHADVHLEPALHLADDRPFDRAVALEGLLDLPPDLELLRLLPREDDVARLGVARLDVDVDLVALVHRELALARGELVDRDGPFGLVADVDRDGVAPDEHHPARDDLALLRLLQAPLEEGTKVLFGADLAIGLLRRLGHQSATPCGRDSLRNAGEPSLHTPVPRGFQERRQKLFAGLDPAHHIAPTSGIPAALPVARHARSGPSVLLEPALDALANDAACSRRRRRWPFLPRSGRAAALADDPLHRLDDVLEGEGGRVEDDGIGGRPQRRVRAPSVAPVALRELAGERGLVDQIGRA